MSLDDERATVEDALDAADELEQVGVRTLPLLLRRRW